MLRKYLMVSLLALSFISLISCSKFLDRTPLSQISPSNAFSSERELGLYTNSFYDALLPQAGDNESSTTLPFYGLHGENADNIALNYLSSQLTGNRTIPVSDGGWNWTQLRNINYFIVNARSGGLDSSIVNKYIGVAKFFRAYFYFYMVARFGDVPWYGDVIASDDEKLLTKSRDSRSLVMDSVLIDIDYAIAHLDSANLKVSEVNKWTALALKSRICLFEGTWRKYHSEYNLSGSTALLASAAEASLAIMQNGPYSLYSSNGTPYHDLFTTASANNNEYMLARYFLKESNIYYSVNYYTISPSFGKPGLTKDLVNSYLTSNGGRFTDKTGYDTLSFFSEMQNRDPRLAQTIRTPGYTRIGSSLMLSPSFSGTCTGYQLTKFVTSSADDQLNGNANPLPIFRYAEVLLNYAEAKAELGTISQNDLNISVNLLRKRVNMTNIDLSEANAFPDTYLTNEYPNVSGTEKGAILEIRRERRVELVMEGFRWNDLMRWKNGQLLAKQFEGMYFRGLGSYDLDQDGKTDLVIYTGTKPGLDASQFLELGVDIQLARGSSGGYIQILPNISKTFNEDRDYLFPLPTQELLLNSNLVQNKGW